MRSNSRGDEDRIQVNSPTRRGPIRPVAGEMIVQEQVIRDTGGLTLRFEKQSNGRFALHISGGPLEGTRTFTFSENGLFESSESRQGNIPPSWNREVC